MGEKYSVCFDFTAMGEKTRLSKNKGVKKKVSDTFLKDWDDVKAPKVFKNTWIGKTFVVRPKSSKNSLDTLKGRVFTVSLADLQSDKTHSSFYTMRFRVDDVQNTTCLTNFCGMELTREKIRHLVNPGLTMIEAYTDVSVTDGYILQIFIIGFTKRASESNRAFSYAQSSQIRRIRKRMIEVVTKEVSSCDLENFMIKLTKEGKRDEGAHSTKLIRKKIENSCKGIYPLDKCIIRKIKVITSPPVDSSKLIALHDIEDVDTVKDIERSNDMPCNTD